MRFLSDLVFEEVKDAPIPADCYRYANLNGLLPLGDHLVLESDLKFFQDKEFLGDHIRRNVDESECC